MSLPKLNLPVYDLILPISKLKIKFRPFTVKEQKIFLMAIENEDLKFTLDNVKQILNSCTLNEVDIDDLSIVDIEYYFLQLRARSVSEIVDLRYRCKHRNEDDKVCNNLLNVEVNLLDIKVKEKEYNDIIQLQNGIGIKMKFPNSSLQKKLNLNEDTSDIIFDFLIECIDYIFDENKIYSTKDVSKEELRQFIESLSVKQLENISLYFNNLPKLSHTIKTKCNKCGTEHEIVLEGLENFLG